MSRAPEIVLTEGNGFTTVHPETEGEKQMSGSSGGLDPRLKNLAIWIIALLVMLYVVLPMILSATCAYTGGFGCEAVRRLNATQMGAHQSSSFGGDVGPRYGQGSPLGQGPAGREYGRCKPCARGFIHSPRPGSPCWCEWSGASVGNFSTGPQCKPCQEGYSHNPKPGKPCWCSPS